MKQQHATAVAESPPMAKDRKDIYIGEAIRRLLTGRKESLTTILNLIAERYLGILARTTPLVCTAREEDVYRAVLAETRGRRLESREIGLFPQMVQDWLNRNPEYPQSAAVRVASELGD